MYNESEIEAALTFRNYRTAIEQLRDNETELLTTIKFTGSNREFTKPGDNKYSQGFLEALVNHSIYYREPKNSEDGKWHFMIPNIKEVPDEDLPA